MKKPFIRAFTLLVFTSCGACKSSAAPAATTSSSATAVSVAPTSKPSGVGCPKASAIRMVRVGTDVPHADKRLRLHERLLKDAQKPEFSPSGEEEVISPDRARKLGSAMHDEPIWIFGGAGKPICKLMPREPLLVHLNTGPTYSRLERLLDGECAYVSAQEPRVAVQQADSPEGCEFFKVTTGADPKATALIPQKKCESPDCEVRSKVRYASGKGRSAQEITATFLYPTAEPECSWKREDFYRIFLRDNTSDKLQRIDDNLDLFGLLVADQGPSIVVTYELPGIMRLFEVSSDGEPKKVGTIQTDIAVEGQEDHSLGPHCGP